VVVVAVAVAVVVSELFSLDFSILNLGEAIQ